MAQLKTIYQKCRVCQGVGTIKQTLTTPEEYDPETTTMDAECPRCDGDGEYEWGTVDMG